MAFHTHTQPELSNLTWYQSQVAKNLVEASANPTHTSLSSNPSHEEDSSIRFSFSMKTEAWRVILVPQTFLIPVLMKSHLGSKGGWRGVMNLRPKLLVHELLASGYKKSRCHEDGDLKYEERRGVWAVETRRWPWVEGGEAGWRSILSCPTKPWAISHWRFKEPNRFLGCKLLLSLLDNVCVVDWLLWCVLIEKPEDNVWLLNKISWICPRIL